MNQLRNKLPLWCFASSVFFVIIIAESIDVSYEELKALNASCSPYDTCVGKGAHTVEFRNCECGPECAVYGTCCLDSPYRGVSRTTVRKRGRAEVCTEVFGSFFSYFMVKECHPKWNGSRKVKTKCEKDIVDVSDPSVFIPASSIQKKKTYKNFFCGLCNNVDEKELRLWNLTLSMNEKVHEDADVLSEQLTYDESLKKWGRWKDRDGRYDFQVVNLIPQAPSYLNEVSGSCIRDLVSTCNTSWKDETVRRKCSSYLAAIYVITLRGNNYDTSGYRNVHCALCNYEDPGSEFDCSESVVREAMPFTLLLDVSSSDGSRVGFLNRCQAGQSYDRFFKKCRSVECGLPGYVIDRNRCVKST